MSPLLLCLLIAGADSPDRQQIIAPNPEISWRAEHCGMCSALPTNNGYRIWLSGRAKGHIDFRIGWIDVDRDFRIKEASAKPCIEPDPQFSGCFSVFMPSVVDAGDHLRMYYVGAVKPFNNDNLNHRPFLATSKDGGKTWERHGPPLLEPESGEFGIGTNCAWKDRDGWRMIYTSVVRLNPNRRYVLRFARSDDGIRWVKPADNLALEIPDEACARPCVWKEGGRYRMIYTHNARGGHYRIRMAESPDGERFTDRGEILSVNPSSSWDNEMVCYGWALPERNLLFYSGNRFGMGGIGVTRLPKMPSKSDNQPR